MELYFYAGIVLLMAVTLFSAPKIVREIISFKLLALLILAFYAAIWLYSKQIVLLTLITGCCLCGVGFILLRYKKIQHSPYHIPEDDVRGRNLFEYRELRAAKITFYKHWYFKLLLVNFCAVVVILLCNYFS